MHQANINEMAAKFTAAYLALKEKKDIERLLTIIKPLVLSAKADGITDKELLEIINSVGLREKFYPAKLKELRTKLLKPDQETPLVDGDNDTLGQDLPAGVISAAQNGHASSGVPQ